MIFFMKNEIKSGFPIDEVPLGFGMALAQNEKALEAFGKLAERQKQRFLYDARHVRNKDEMQNLVKRIGEWQ